MTRKSDFPTAALGFFGGAIVIAAWLFFVSHQTTKKFEAREKAAEHKTQ
jgi:hypothetical protein